MAAALACRNSRLEVPEPDMPLMFANGFGNKFEPPNISDSVALAPEGRQMPAIYTLGHSTRSEAEFLSVLSAFSIEMVADIRTVPQSRKNPQFNKDQFSLWLDCSGIAYVHLRDLGGLRHARKDSINTAWKNASFRGYADYMQTAQFEEALEELIRLGCSKTTVIVCAEAVPWRCHRSLVGDALLIRGIEVEDIFTATASRPHRLTPWARVDQLRITYPALTES